MEEERLLIVSTSSSLSRVTNRGSFSCPGEGCLVLRPSLTSTEVGFHACDVCKGQEEGLT